jgi:hypothetical protein
MRKEQLIAIILGSLLGVTVAFILWKLPRQNNTPAKGGPQEISQKSDGTMTTGTDFSIVSPSQNSVAREETLEIKGFARAGATVVSISEKTALAKASSAGEFSIDASLIPGINTVRLWSFEKDAEPKLTETTLIYSTQLDLDELSRDAVAMMGAITDIASDTLQVRTQDGEIEQLSISSDTTYGSVVNTSKEIGFSDLAIGDFVAALGAKNGDNVMVVKRILVTTQKKPQEIGVIAGTVKALSSSEFLVQTFGSVEEVSIDAKSGVKVYSAKEEEIAITRLLNAKEDDQIVIIGDYEDDELVASTIILL